jgi:hypothetical protein
VATVVLEPFLEAGGAEEQAALALAAGCMLIEPENPYDRGSFNQEFTGLLGGSGGDFTGNGVARDRDDVTHALFAACRDHGTDPDAFLDAVTGALRLSAEDLQQAIDDACTRFSSWRERNEDDPYAPESFDRVPASVTAVLGDDLTPESLVEAYCA